jgi:hypothetical protein
MRRLTYPFITLGAVGLLAVAAFLVWGIPYFFRPVALSDALATFGSQSARGRVELASRGLGATMPPCPPPTSSASPGAPCAPTACARR